MKHKHFFSFITAVIMMFSSFSLLPTKNIIPIKANALDSHIESALQWAVNIANDNSHGYSQTSRWGPDYDCSSLVISALKQAGIDVGSASWTGDMRANLTAHGFTWIPWSSLGGSGNLQRGDILLNELYHTEFCLSSTQLVGANSNRGYSQTGDQTGTEIYIKNYFDYSSGWDGVLRYNVVETKWYNGYEPVNLGNSFYARIKNQYAGWNITANNANAEGQETKNDNSQIWKFERLSNGSYKITNQADGGCLDVTNYAESGDGTNVQTWIDNGETAQKFFIYKMYGAYYLRAECTDLPLDMDMNTGNVSVWGFGADWNPQKFEIQKIDLNGTLPIDLGTDFYARIKNQYAGWSITANNANAEGQETKNISSQIWKFERLSDGSYKITNRADGGCLDVTNYAESGDGTNVQTWIDNGETAQKFFIYKMYGAYYLRAECTDLVLDMDMNTGNVSVWGFGADWNPQKFEIEKYDEEPPIIHKIEAIDITLNGFKLVISATDTAGIENISADVSTWRGFETDGKKITGTKSGDNWIFDVKVSDFNTSYGAYYCTAVVTDVTGNTVKSATKEVKVGVITCTFDANGGNVEQQDKILVYGESYARNGELPIPTRAGYSFVGWYTDKTDGAKVTNDTKLSVATNQTLYAHWLRNIGDINSDGQQSVLDAVILQKYLLKRDSFTKEQFDGADINQDGKVNVYDLILLKKRLLNGK